MKFKESIFYLVYNQFMTKNKYYLAIILVLLLAMAQINFEEIKNNKQETTNIKQKEKLSIQKQTNLYNIKNINLYSSPTDTLFLLNFKAYNNLRGTISPQSTCNIVEGKKNAGMNYLSGGYLSYSGILFLFISLLSISSGIDIFEKKQLTKFLCSIKKQNYNRITAQMAMSHTIMILIFTTIALSSTMVLAYINGIISMELLSTLYLLLLSILITVFFLFLGGAVTALINKRGPRFVVITAAYIMMVIVFPWSISKIPANIFHRVSESTTEQNQIKVLHISNSKPKSSQSMTLKHKQSTPNLSKHSTKSAQSTPSKDQQETAREKDRLIESIEMDHQEQILGKINDYRKMSMLLPSTLFLATANELSGYGLNNYCKFYRFLETRRREFHGYNVNKISRVINETPNEWFTKDREIIFKAHPELPRYYYTGIGFTFIYIGVLGFLAFHFGNKQMFPAKRRKGEAAGISLEIRAGDSGVVFSVEKYQRSKIISIFFGKPSTEVEIDLIKHGKSIDVLENGFVYLANTEMFKHVKPEALHVFLFGDPMVQERSPEEMLFEYAVLKEHTIVMDGFLDGAGPCFIKDIKCHIANKELFCLLVSGDYYVVKEMADAGSPPQCFSTDLHSRSILERNAV